LHRLPIPLPLSSKLYLTKSRVLKIRFWWMIALYLILI
jgi:hypothetical protein